VILTRIVSWYDAEIERVLFGVDLLADGSWRQAFPPVDTVDKARELLARLLPEDRECS
jgi:hypothetical protein